jgi:hypothetical protein
MKLSSYETGLIWRQVLHRVLAPFNRKVCFLIHRYILMFSYGFNIHNHMLFVVCRRFLCRILQGWKKAFWLNDRHKNLSQEEKFHRIHKLHQIASGKMPVRKESSKYCKSYAHWLRAISTCKIYINSVPELFEYAVYIQYFFHHLLFNISVRHVIHAVSYLSTLIFSRSFSRFPWTNLIESETMHQTTVRRKSHTR